MAKEEWGVKRACPKCSVRFYDLQNDPMTCPSCEEEFSLESLTDTGKSRVAHDKKAAAKPDVDEADVVLDDEDDSATTTTTTDEALLDDDDDETVNLEEIADVAKEDDDS